ncbi:MAG: extracellular solute-binding protein [Clostridia bacterium]|nr:extracellular solute-binding protein [Clostridia bacterium]
MKKFSALLMAVIMLLSVASFTAMAEEAPIKISIYYSDNSTLPFREDWRVISYLEEKYNVDLVFEPIPMTDYGTKVTNVLNNQGDDTPDVILGTSTAGGNAALALNGGAYAVNTNPDWTPNFNARVAEFGLEQNVEMLKLGDGNLYYLPQLFDKPFFDGGLILRQDYLEAKGFDAPKTFEDLHQILLAYKADYPDSIPLTSIVNIYVLQRMTMPSFGISLGRSTSTGTRVLSWDYDTQTYFAGALSENYKEYIRFFSQMYKEGLIDPEFSQDDAAATRKLATGLSCAVYGYYDQIGGWEAASEIEGLKLNMYPSLEGPNGAHHQPKSSTGNGILFPAKTMQRPDFEQVVRKIDEVFFSEEAAKVWCLGVEGETYTMDGDKVVFSDDIMAHEFEEGIYKYMQNAYGCGCDGTQVVWYNAREMTKYDENYSRINAEVAAMDNCIQYVPATPAFDDEAAEEAALLQTALADSFFVWDAAFMRGEKDIDADWAEYEQELKDKGIDEFLGLYNEYNKYQ